MPGTVTEGIGPFASIIMVVDTVLHVTRSVASCAFWNRRQRPATPLRTLCVVAFDFIARTGGQRLRREEAHGPELPARLGQLINDHFDQHQLRKCSYRRLRKQLATNETARSVYRGYFRDLHRPNGTGRGFGFRVVREFGRKPPTIGDSGPDLPVGAGRNRLWSTERRRRGR